jgi:hypothetical protein
MLPIPQIPYGLIGQGIALLLSILAFTEAGDKGKILLVALWTLSYFLPLIFPSNIMSQALLFLRLAIGIGCFIYLKHQGYFSK